MSATLGATTYTSVTWTAGDVITEAKMDYMVANDQAYDSHQDQGLILTNNYSYAGYTTAAAERSLIKMASSDDIIIGDTDLTGHVETVNGTFQDIQVASDGATVTFDLSNGDIHQVTLGGNRTLALSNENVGQRFIIRLIQDGSGSRTVTWFSTVDWGAYGTPVLSTTGGEEDWFVFICVSAGNYVGIPVFFGE